MNKPIAILSSFVLGIGLAISAYALTLNPSDKTTTSNSNQQSQLAKDPFANDPFFQSYSDVFKEIDRMQQAMQRLMNSQFSRMQNTLTNRFPDLNSNSLNNIQVKEEKNQLIYKIKLPKGSDNKINVTVNDGKLFISANVSQKITREDDNSRSVSYSRSNNTQSFQIPKGYDEKSMTTQMKGNNLIVILKKSG